MKDAESGEGRARPVLGGSKAVCLGHGWPGGELDSVLQRQMLPVLVGFYSMVGIF